MVENAEVDSVGGSGDYKDETVKKSPLTSKNWNKATDFLTPNAK